MPSLRESEALTRVGPGTPMGEMMRQYWIPAAMSSELEADGAPVRLKLLGEKLIAFRDTSGRVGILDHRCPHRSASLFFGRNEAGGLRCVYHGWKYAVDGACLDMPNLPPTVFYVIDPKDPIHGARSEMIAERQSRLQTDADFTRRFSHLPPRSEESPRELVVRYLARSATAAAVGR